MCGWVWVFKKKKNQTSQTPVNPLMKNGKNGVQLWLCLEEASDWGRSTETAGKKKKEESHYWGGSHMTCQKTCWRFSKYVGKDCVVCLIWWEQSWTFLILVQSATFDDNPDFSLHLLVALRMPPSHWSMVLVAYRYEDTVHQHGSGNWLWLRARWMESNPG